VACVDGNEVVVEELTFDVEAEAFERWLAREAEAWDDLLRAQDGFLGKEVWLDPDGAGTTVRVLVWWASRTQWKAVDPEALADADRRMGDLLRPSRCREYRRVRLVGVGT
jgi:uncharacterized protein (TIGR03792 family)